MNHTQRETTDTTRLAFQATIHCLTGCGIGEVLGLGGATLLGLGNAASIVLGSRRIPGPGDKSRGGSDAGRPASTRSMAVKSSAGPMGLVRKSSMPAARQRSRSSCLERAVKAQSALSVGE